VPPQTPFLSLTFGGSEPSRGFLYRCWSWVAFNYVNSVFNKCFELYL